jgi:hypothetical protein
MILPRPRPASAALGAPLGYSCSSAALDLLALPPRTLRAPASLCVRRVTTPRPTSLILQAGAEVATGAASRFTAGEEMLPLPGAIAVPPPRSPEDALLLASCPTAASCIPATFLAFFQERWWSMMSLFSLRR